jgi:hypothetical protein
MCFRDRQTSIFDLTTLQGWSMSPESEMSLTGAAYPFYDEKPRAVCRMCGFSSRGCSGVRRLGVAPMEEGSDGTVHGDLV